MDQIGPYQIQGELGRGGMGIVYRGIDPVIGRTVAVKTLHTADFGDSAEQEKLKERLFREAKSAGILSHPGIVTIYQAGQDKDVLFIAMEFIDGPNLADALARTRPGVELVLDLLKQAAEALDYAHSKGVIHRDIKPANLLLQSEGRIKIADFGIAKLASSNLTRTGTTVGSPAYMSPEQIRAQGIDGRADQYSLAVLAFEMLTGVRPYDSDTITALVFKIVFEQPDLTALNQIPGGDRFEPVFRKALSKAAEDRYPNCMGFWQALSSAAGSGVQPKFDVTVPMPPSGKTEPRPLPLPPPPPLPLPPKSTGLSGMILGIAGGLALLIGGTGYWMYSHQEPQHPVEKVPIEKVQKADSPPPPPLQDPEKASPPVLVQRVEAQYTPDALKAGIQGLVKLRVGINEQGQVEEAEVIGPLDPGLDLKAIEAVKQWKFQPAMLKGKAVAMRSQVELEFLIKK